MRFDQQLLLSLGLDTKLLNLVIFVINFVSQGNGVVETYRDGRVCSQCSRDWSPWGLDLL